MVERKPPKEKFRVIGVDTFEGPCADWIVGDFDTAEEALSVAKQKGGEMTMMHVYNDKEEHIGQAGWF